MGPGNGRGEGGGRRREGEEGGGYLKSEHILFLVGKVPHTGSGAEVTLDELCRLLQCRVLFLLLLEHASLQLRRCFDRQMARAVRRTAAGRGRSRAEDVSHLCVYNNNQTP